jgi:predicted N-acetyltransferase YhbS
MEIRAALRSERDEVLDLLALWYNNRAFFALYNQNDPAFRDELCLVARDRGALVSTVQIFDRPINLADASIPMGGIGSVFTREDYRHRGVASELMRLAVKTLEREGFEASLLFAERLTFYNQFGWREVTRKFSVLPNAHELRVSEPLEVGAFDADRDLRAVVAIHRAYSGRIDVTAVRDESAWRGNLLFAGNQERDPAEGSQEYFAVARIGGAIRAYARATHFHGIPMVMEYGYLPGETEVMVSLLRYFGETAAGRPPSFPLVGDHRRAALLTKRATDASPAALITHTAHDPDLESRLAAAGSPVIYHDDRNFMWRVISPQRLARRFGTSIAAAPARFFEVVASPRSLYWTSDRF